MRAIGKNSGPWSGQNRSNQRSAGNRTAFREDEIRLTQQKVTSASDVADLLMPQMRDLKTEVFKVVYLNA